MTRLIACVGQIKHQTALSLAYGTGLRVGEVVALKVGDIDSKRMTLRVEQGKGLKDRYAMLSPVLLEAIEHGTAPLHLGCELAQGYGKARPMPGADMPAWVAAWQPDDAWSGLK